jgi:NEDD4-binding protein 2
MRGLPGSGKSTLAKELGKNGVVFSTDDFFMDQGEYKFNPNLLGKYHQLNYEKTVEAMQKGLSPIVVDNTNTQPFEMKNYVHAAEKYGYSIEFKEPQTEWAWNANELAKRNTHNVPVETIQKMVDRYDRNIDLDYIKNSKAPWEKK